MDLCVAMWLLGCSEWVKGVAMWLLGCFEWICVLLWCSEWV